MQPDEDGRAQLVGVIEEALGHALSADIRDAFLRVSRAHFVPRYFKQVQPGEWASFPTEGSVYQDRPFTTKVNTKQMPCSSSSQPSIIAAMLEALDLFPGMQVLEIGTGTGYNAALLAEIIGQKGSITSIDIDADLVQEASRRLREVGYTNVRVKIGDALGTLPEGQFDRVILTGGYPQILPAWVHCLRPGGKIVGNLLGTLATPLFCLTKYPDEVRGSLLSVPCFFMSLYPQSDGGKDTIAPGARIALAPYLAMPLIEVGKTTMFVEALDDLSLRIFLDTHLPGISDAAPLYRWATTTSVCYLPGVCSLSGDVLTYG